MGTDGSELDSNWDEMALHKGTDCHCLSSTVRFKVPEQLVR